MLNWPNLGTVNTFLVRFGGISGLFGLAMGILARLRLAKKDEPWLDQTRLIAGEACQNDMIRCN